MQFPWKESYLLLFSFIPCYSQELFLVRDILLFQYVGKTTCTCYRMMQLPEFLPLLPRIIQSSSAICSSCRASSMALPYLPGISSSSRCVSWFPCIHLHYIASSRRYVSRSLCHPAFSICCHLLCKFTC